MQRGLGSLAKLPLLLPFFFFCSSIICTCETLLQGHGASCLRWQASWTALPPSRARAWSSPSRLIQAAGGAPWFWKAVQSCQWLGARSCWRPFSSFLIADHVFTSLQLVNAPVLIGDFRLVVLRLLKKLLAAKCSSVFVLLLQGQ